MSNWEGEAIRAGSVDASVSMVLMRGRMSVGVVGEGEFRRVSLAREVMRLDWSLSQRLPSQVSQPQVGTYLRLWPCWVRSCRALLWSVKRWVEVGLVMSDVPLLIFRSVLRMRRTIVFVGRRLC